MKFKKYNWPTFIGIAILGMSVSCTPEEIGTGNGLTDASLDAAFTIATDGPNNFTLKASSTSYILSKWDIDDGAGSFIGNMEQPIFVPDAGTYSITHYAVGKGGVEESVSEELVVPVSDPNAGNVVLGGKFDTAEDISKWTVVNISASGVEWTFADGKAFVDGGGWSQKGIYQALELIEGKTYSIDLIASSTSGVNQTWFEVYCSTTAPIDGTDYNTGNGGGPMLRSINWWDGCAASPFSGKISVIGCKADNNKGKFTAPEDPDADTTVTMYLVVKCGGNDLMDGISVDNVEVRGIQ